jgi:hypothetical protein
VKRETFHVKTRSSPLFLGVKIRFKLVCPREVNFNSESLFQL